VQELLSGEERRRAVAALLDDAGQSQAHGPDAVLDVGSAHRRSHQPANPKADESASVSARGASSTTSMMASGMIRRPSAAAGENGSMPAESMYGPRTTFLGVPSVDPEDAEALSAAQVVVVGAPFDGGTSHRAGCRFGPSAIRATDYLPHDGRRPHVALGVDPLEELGIVDVGDVTMPPGDIEGSLDRLRQVVERVARAGAVPVVLGGDHTIALPDASGVAAHVGWGRVSVVHFDAHADTADLQFGSLYGHGTPMRRLIESGAVHGDKFVQIGLRGYWPDADTLHWMADQRMRSYDMAEIVDRGLDRCLDEAFAIATTDCDGVFLSVDVDVVDPGNAPGTGTPEPGGLSPRELLDAVRRAGMELPLAGMDVVEVAPPYDHAEVTAYLANRVVLEALSGMAWRRRPDDRRRRPAGPLLDGRG
jgi:agmatinase